MGMGVWVGHVTNHLRADLPWPMFDRVKSFSSCWLQSIIPSGRCICGPTKLAKIPLSLEISQEGPILKNPLFQWPQMHWTCSKTPMENWSEWTWKWGENDFFGPLLPFHSQCPMSKESCQPSSFKCSSTSPFMGVITMTGSLCGPQNSLQSLAVKHQWSTQLLFGPFIKVGKWPKQQVKMTPKIPIPNSRALWGGVNLSFFQKRLNAPFDKDPEGTEKKPQLNSMKNIRFRQSSNRRELGESYGMCSA